MTTQANQMIIGRVGSGVKCCILFNEGLERNGRHSGNARIILAIGAAPALLWADCLC